MDVTELLFLGVVALIVVVSVVLIAQEQRRNRVTEAARAAEWAAGWQADYGTPPPPGLRPPSQVAQLSPGPARPRTDPVAVLALVFGLLGGLLAIPLGHIALHRIQRSGDGGRGLAYTGLVIGYVCLIVYGFAAYVLFNL